MIRHYWIIALRNLKRHLSFSLINIVGLGLGIATCLLLAAWIMHEKSYDSFHVLGDRIYRGQLATQFGGKAGAGTTTPLALAPTLQSFPEVDEVVRIYNPSARSPYIVIYENKMFQETRYLFADSAFFKVFSFHLLKGDPSAALKEPFSVVLTETMVKKYFGDSDPMGKVISLNNLRQHTVTGVVADAPDNSQIQFDFLASFSSLPQSQGEQGWWPANYQTYFVLNKQSGIDQLWNKTNAVVREALASRLVRPDDYIWYDFMKLVDIHLRSEYADEPEVVGSIMYVYIFGGISILIILIASINYVNLATARGLERAKEVGIRKVVGAARVQLFKQFVLESLFITSLALVFGLLMAHLLLPLFNEVTGKSFGQGVFYGPLFLIAIMGVTFLVSVMSCVYPAVVMTMISPLRILKGLKDSGGGSMRRSLVVIQFTISVMLLVGTVVILKQVDYIHRVPLGYKKEGVVVLPLDSRSKPLFDQLRSEFIRSGVATYAGRATETPVFIKGGYGVYWGSMKENESMSVSAVAGDIDFVPALGMEIIEGRNFVQTDFDRVISDTLYSFIVNESALKAMDIAPDKATGTRAVLSGRRGEIVGVVSDFHYLPLHRPIGPLVIFNQNQYNFMLVRLGDGEFEGNIEKLRQICTTLAPHRPFEYQFLVEQYDRLYASEQRMGTVFLAFSGLAILIACFGLVGLVSFSTTQKVKEIGIRKALGATPLSIVLLITNEFTRLVIISIVIGLPCAYFLMTHWLNDFAYRTQIGILPLILPAGLCVLIAFGTSAFRSIKASQARPTDSLRSE